jgi:parvulin-like peptidyl-prolyl isomerase
MGTPDHPALKTHPAALLLALWPALLAVAAPAAAAQQPDSAPAPAPAPVPRGLRSIFLTPMYHDELPPPVRTLRAIQINWKGSEMATADVTRTREEAWQLTLELIARLRAGVSFDELSRNHSSLPNRHLGGVLGSFAQGMLGPQLDAFLFGAQLDAVSEPLESPRGWLVLQRVESYAAARTLLVSGNTSESLQRCLDLATRVRAGEDFARLCREHSADDLTRVRDGALAIFERGPSDQLLKAAAFNLPIGGLSQPIESPLGWHLVQRVPVDSIDPALADPVWVRARAILVAQKVVPLGAPSAERSSERALEIAMKLQERVLGGEDMAELARAHCDDFGGRERAGDLGWIHRRHPNKLHFLDSLYSAMPGELLEPFETSAGWVLMRREL